MKLCVKSHVLQHEILANSLAVLLVCECNTTLVSRRFGNRKISCTDCKFRFVCATCELLDPDGQKMVKS